MGYPNTSILKKHDPMGSSFSEIDSFKVSYRLHVRLDIKLNTANKIYWRYKETVYFINGHNF